MILFFVGVSSAHAASLYLEPQSGTYSEGTSFSIKVRVDNQDECINAGSVVLKYPTASIKAIDVVRGESIFTLWVEDPVIDHTNGEVRFSGGLPGGYCGRVEGDPGLTNVLAEVIFQVPGLSIGEKGPATGAITVGKETEVLLNDGRGTKAELIVGNSVFNIVPPGEGIDAPDWFRSVNEDNIVPEPFSIELVRNDSVFDGKWFIVFNTLDKQTGIDHFEVFEADRKNGEYVYGKKDVLAIWEKAESPHLLDDQSLNSVIRVRAIDKAGNERLAGYIPDESLRKSIRGPISKGMFYIVLGILGILILAGAVFFMYKKMKKKKDDVRDTIIESAEGTEHFEENTQIEEGHIDQNEGNETEENNQNTTS